MSDINIDIRTEGPGPGQHSRQKVVADKESFMVTDRQGNHEHTPIHTEIKTWDLPVASALTLGSDVHFLSSVNGAGSTVSRDTDAYLTLTSGTTSGFYSMVNGISGTPWRLRVNISTAADFRALVRAPAGSGTGDLIVVGFDEDNTVLNPTSGSGDVVAFVYDDQQALTTGLTAAQHENWLLQQSINGVDTFYDSGIKFEASKEFHFRIKWLEGIQQPSWYINGAFIRNGVENDDSPYRLYTKIGVQSTNASAAEISCKYATLAINTTMN